MKNSNYTLPNFLIAGLFVMVQFYSISQITPGKKTDSIVTIDLSIQHGDRLRLLNDCSSLNNDVFVIIRNETDSIVRFYENWNSYGYYNFTFEIKTADSNYLVSRPHKLWYRNFPSHHSVSPDESIVFQFDLIDTACAENRLGCAVFEDDRLEDAIFEDGWIGLPNVPDTAFIRVIYSLPSEYASYPLPQLNYKDYLDGENELNEIDPNSPDEENEDRIYIFSQTIVSDWRKVHITR